MTQLLQLHEAVANPSPAHRYRLQIPLKAFEVPDWSWYLDEQRVFRTIEYRVLESFPGRLYDLKIGTADSATESKRDLDEALADLDGVVEESREEGLTPPSSDVVENARSLVRSMYDIRPCRYEVSAAPDGEVIVEAFGYKRSVVVLCNSRGGVLCSVYVNGRHRHAEYDSAETLPDGFFREALHALDGAVPNR